MRVLVKAAWLAAAAVLCVQPARAQTTLKGAVEGDVVDAATEQGIAGARVRIQSGQDDPLVTTTDGQGHFRFAGLEFKSYQVDARYPGFMSSKEAARGYPGAEMVRPVVNSPNGQVRLEMQRYAAIVGKVTDALGIPLEGVGVEALQRYPIGERRSGYMYNDGSYQYVGHERALTDDLGEYRIAPLGAGSYYVLVRPGSNYFASQPSMRPPLDARQHATFYPHALKPSETKPVAVAEGKELRVDLQIVSQGGVKVSGRILGLAAAAQPGALASVHVSALSPGASNGFATLIGDRFAAADLLPGKYVVEAGQYAAGDFTNQNPLAAARKTVDVGTEDVDGIDLTLAPTPDVEGRVVFESGCAAVPVGIQLQEDFHLPRSLHVDADGRFVLQHLFPGKYKAYVRPESRSSAFATSARLGDVEVLADGFEVTAETKGPLRITMSCRRR
jgi:hypothetical protein